LFVCMMYCVYEEVRFRYGNAVTKDLWQALEGASKMPLEDMMTTWTKQMGYPVVTVVRAAVCTLHTSSVLIERVTFATCYWDDPRFVTSGCGMIVTRMMIHNSRSLLCRITGKCLKHGFYRPHRMYCPRSRRIQTTMKRRFGTFRSRLPLRKTVRQLSTASGFGLRQRNEKCLPEMNLLHG
jgi:hypothetical protein